MAHRHKSQWRQKVSRLKYRKVNETLTTFGLDFQVLFGTMNKLNSDLISGRSFLQHHCVVSFLMRGNKAPMKIFQEKPSDHSSVAAANISAPRFLNS